MARTLANAVEELAAGSITRALLNTVTAGSAVITKLIAGANIGLSSTGADAGTGDVTVSAGVASATNTGLGSLALVSYTTGTQNAAFGSLALRLNTTGSVNSAGGYSALSSNIGGINNSAFALNANPSGNQNSALGSNSLVANTTGINNTASGISALSGNTTGNYNSAFGGFSLSANIAGVSNSAVGYTTLGDINGASASYNTAVGYNTGRGITTGASNTILGANITGLAAGLTGAIILAAGDGVSRIDYGMSTAAVWTLAAPLKKLVKTVALLPGASSVGAGAEAFVTDATATMAAGHGTAVAGGGSNKVPVYSDGSSWIIG